ncbi:FAD-dependent oxidoreductase [Nocardia tengchongensis]|uniref:FAD-dependent oxidoreductase n=1 Tax=Nocardia tengchongensis TaxID=2055889 RepID=UPI00360893EE
MSDRGLGVRVVHEGRIAVIGLGAAGLSACLAAAELGWSVIGFDRSTIGGEAAASAGRSKIIRFGYTDPFYAELMRDTRPRWERLERDTGSPLINLCGMLHFGVGGATGTDAVIESLERSGQDCEILAAAQTSGRTGLHLRTGEIGVYERNAGMMTPASVFQALSARASALGVTLHENTAVSAIDDTGACVTVMTSNGPVIVDRVIIAAGGQFGRFAPAAASQLTVTRQYQIVCGSPELVASGHSCSWMDVTADEWYGMVNAGSGIHIMGVHEPATVVDPDQPIDDAELRQSVEVQLEYLRERLALNSRQLTLREVRTCHYTNTASKDFVIDRLPGGSTVLLSACSGHGFKFTITSGYLAAQLACTDAPPVPRFQLSAVSSKA